MLISVLLAVHITSGTLALLLGCIAAIAAKGRKLHIVSGRIFTLFMMLCASAGLCISLLKGNGFLLAISLFTLYLVLSGYLFGKIRKMDRLLMVLRPVALAGILATVYMLWVGFKTGGQSMVVLLAFGGLLGVFSSIDLLKPPAARSRIPRHAGRMGGALIAAITAVLVVNAHFEPAWIVWLGPSMVGSVILTIGIRRWVKKHQSPIVC